MALRSSPICLYRKPYLCNVFFPITKIYGRAGYVDDPLPSIVHIAIWDACLHCVALLRSTTWWFPDNTFFLLGVWSP